MANLRENLAENIRIRRGGMTQHAFARRLGLHQSTINRIELGLQNVTLDTVQLICDRLHCSAGDLLDRPMGQ